jgi:hypothetical protein
MATTKMKNYAKAGPGDKVPGSEQGKGSKIGRVLGIVGPSIGAAAVAIKAGMDKRKEKREIKKGIKIEVDKKAINIKDSNNPINYPKSGTTTTGSGSVSKAKYGTSVGATKMNKMKYKTGGMVNANAKITAAKAATGSVGGISKAISKGAVKSTSPKGKVGGTSTAPKCASPKKTK